MKKPQFYTCPIPGKKKIAAKVQQKRPWLAPPGIPVGRVSTVQKNAQKTTLKNNNSFSIILKKNSLIQQPNFSLSENYIYYLKINASPKVFQKLLKTCKYFKINQKFIVLNGISSNKFPWYSSEPFDNENIPRESKIFIFGERINFSNSNDFVSIYPKLFYINVKWITLKCQNNILYKEFLFLISSGKISWLHLDKSSIKYVNGNWVEVGEIIEKVPLIKKFTYYAPKNYGNDIFTPKASQKLAKLPIFPNLEQFHIGEKYEIQTFLCSIGYAIFKNKHLSAFCTQCPWFLKKKPLI